MGRDGQSEWTQRGSSLLRVCVVGLAVGGLVVRVFFPQLRGAGLSGAALLLILPLWGCGIAGLGMLAVGRLERRLRSRAQ